MTFYTASKLNLLWWEPTDRKIALNKGWSYLNLLLSTLAFVGGAYWSGSLSYSRNTNWNLNIGVPLYILAALFTVIFLHYDTLCCASLGEGLVAVYDPSNPDANLVFRDGQVSILTIAPFLNYYHYM